MSINIIEIYDDLRICGCGNPELTINIIKDILNIRSKNLDVKSEEIELAKLFNLEKPSDNIIGLCNFLLYILDDFEFLSHGSSIYSAKLTNKGKQLLEKLNQITEDDYL